MTTWSFATLGIVHKPVLPAFDASSWLCVAEFATHDLANFLWSFPTLEMDVSFELFSLIRVELVDRVPKEASWALQQISTRPVNPKLLAELSEFTNSLLEFAWSFAFSEQDMGQMSAVVRSSLFSLARAIDAKCSSDSLLGPSSGAAPYSMGPNWDFEVPIVVQDLFGIVAILKPPHWEVDARVGGSEQKATEGGAPLLSSFLRRHFPKDVYPLLHSNERQFGIIHRLDTPSSGLILAGKNFQGYYTLRWQQDTYELGREYLVLCHGCMSWGSRVVNARIKTTKTDPVTSTVNEEGKPAWTLIEPLCFLNRPNGDRFTLVAIRIRTGRTHQIRVHTKHIGHPTVTDGRYTNQIIYNRDREWCPRNWLHRYRLTFTDTADILREALAPLPDDLMAVLRKLHPESDARSIDIFQQLLAGWVPSAGVW